VEPNLVGEGLSVADNVQKVDRIVDGHYVAAGQCQRRGHIRGVEELNTLFAQAHVEAPAIAGLGLGIALQQGKVRRQIPELVPVAGRSHQDEGIFAVEVGQGVYQVAGVGAGAKVTDSADIDGYFHRVASAVLGRSTERR
jgi:hypothetical protein